MKFLHDRKQVGVVALLSVLLGAAALVMGAGSASADTCGTTNGTLGDATVYVPGVVAADLDANTTGGGDPGFYLCVVPPGQGVGVGVHDASTGAVGYQVDFLACGSLTPGCTGFEDTGAEVEPSAATNGPGATTAGTGGSVGTGSGTCTYANGTPSCPGGATIAGVTVHEGDLPSVTTTNTTPPPACTGVNNTCPGAYVIVGGDTSNDTVDTRVLSTPVRHDMPRNCVQVNSICPP